MSGWRAWAIWIFAVIFTIEETTYFGWNGIPHTPGEVVCDGIAMLIFAIGIAVSK